MSYSLNHFTDVLVDSYILYKILIYFILSCLLIYISKVNSIIVNTVEESGLMISKNLALAALDYVQYVHYDMI